MDNAAADFLRELNTRQEADPNREPSGATIAAALNLDRQDAERTLTELLAEARVEIIPTTALAASGPLDELLKITTHGRIALDRADTSTVGEDTARRFLRSLSDHLTARNQRRINASVVAQALRLDHNTTAATIDELAAVGLITAHSSTGKAGGRLNDILGLTSDGAHAVTKARAERVGSRPGDPLENTFTPRDLPVLTEAARILDSEAGMYGCAVRDLVDATGFTLIQVELALRALETDGMLEVIWAHPRQASRVSGLSSDARRAVKLWPSAESALDRMLAALDAIAENTEDPDTRTKAQKFAAWLRASSTTVGLSVASAAITGQLPGQ